VAGPPLSIIPRQGAGHRPNPLQETPQASWVARYFEVGPCLPLSLVVCGALEDQMHGGLFSTAAVGTGVRVPIHHLSQPPKSTQPSTLHRMVKNVLAFRLSNNKW